MSIGIDVIYENGRFIFEKTAQKRIRENKGNNLLVTPDDYVVLDLETTGLSPGIDEIIEVSALKCVDNAVVDSFSTLVCPSDIEYVSDFITKLTGITQDMLLGKPCISEVIPDLLNFIGENIVVAHNAHFDINFLYDACEYEKDIIFSNDFIDTLRIARRALPELEKHSLSAVAKHFEINTEGTHRALKDCEIVQDVYQKLKAIVKMNPEIFIQKSTIDLRTISATTQNINPDNPFYGKECVFTGKLERMLRADAAQLVVNLGATAGNNVTLKTNFLILGNNDYCSTIKDGKSSKQKKAEKLILSGADIQIIPEDIFYEMISDYQVLSKQ